MQEDTSIYYMLGYHSTNPARDGRYRRITVQVNRPGVKIDYRRGYYAPADFQHSNQEDRERQLDEELASDLPSTDLPVYLAAALLPHRGQQVLCAGFAGRARLGNSFIHNSDQDKATLDVLGIVTDRKKRPVGEMRDTVKLAVNASQLRCSARTCSTTAASFCRPASII